MKILIYGAGVLGSLYAARLANAGQDVILLARDRRLAELQAHGIVIEDADTGQQTISHVRLVEQLAPDDTYDLIIVLMRKNQVEAILPALAANRRTPGVLFMTNNAAGPEPYIAALGRERVLLGFPGAGGVRAGHVIRTALAARRSQPTTIGELDGALTPRLQQIAAMFEAAGLPVAINRTMDAWLKTHAALVSPIANGIYLAGGDNYRLARTRDGMVLVIRAMREGLAVLQALDIPITPPRYRRLLSLPEPLLAAVLRRGFASERAALVLAGHANAARDEMRCLADEFRVLARSSAIPTPALDRLYAYLDPATPPLPDGNADLGLDWRAIGAGSGAVIGAVLGAGLVRANRGPGGLGGALGGLLLGRRLGTPRRMPLAAPWQRALAQRHGAAEAARLIGLVEGRYDELYARRVRYANRAMRMHLETRILPFLALYQVLRAASGDQQAALAEVDELLHVVFQGQRQLIALLGRLPAPFAIFRPLARWITVNEFPPEGWATEWIENSDQRLAFNMRSCLYFDTLTINGAPELIAHICACDDWLFAALPPSIAWERTTTFGRGGDRCDFCWRRVATDAARPAQVEYSA